MAETSKFEYTEASSFPEIPNLKFRLIKFQLRSGKWLNLRVRDALSLKKLFIRYQPLNAYWSTSQWLSPTKIEHPNYQVADRCLIGSDLHLEVDDDEGNLQRASKEMLKLTSAMTSAGYKLKALVKSGMKGFHAYYESKVSLDTDPRERLKEIIKEKEKVTGFLEKKGINIDAPVCKDLFRVLRIWNSYHGTTGQQCKLITQHTLQSLAKGNDLENQINKGFPSSRELTGKPDGGLGLTKPNRIGKFIRNKVEGTKDRYILYTIYNNLQELEKDMSKLQKMYGFGTYHVLTDKIKYFALCLDAITKRRLDKIYHNSKSLNRRKWLRFHNLYIKTSIILSKKLEVLEEKMYELKSFKHKNNVLKSQPHIDFLGIKDLKGIGKDKNTIYQTIFTTGDVK